MVSPPRVVKGAPFDPCENIALVSVLRAVRKGASASLIVESVLPFGRNRVVEHLAFVERKRLVRYDERVLRLTEEGELFLTAYDMLTGPPAQPDPDNLPNTPSR
jgi:hypothetical protein